VPLAELLRRVGPTAGARDLVFRGADTGIEPGHTEPIRYERGLSLDDARESETLLAYTMNGEPLPVEHGFPLRVVVPGWYGMASVKWLTEIELVAETFAGHFHSAAYFYDWGTAREPLTVQNVRSLITEPEDESEVAAGELLIRGVAWSGAALIERVEVSIDDGEWQQARLLGERSPHCWRQWELTATVEPGTSAIRARATDLAGRTQPDEPRWNRLGYGNNAVKEVRIQIR
jgi:DMSO/TMAO reductase YedYZ molybdopterin-dependent catalytic subunit